ncbi:SGNH/GDSL hydrolase family protein [Luteolibacter sp. SL250]|uniref:SGNH/GDSL hydrolase family protein n=1 Tax=Luteolibacter sp. SL250 TaxID=2995170 RepID=UPI00227136BB|nr:SGNH/GDSL hydrolase family protein [Luteolibacter sp. SL250]WAC21715.1 SGNH/GDSL hydrolase family protein [Luteolibacter sp. SL250]
MKPALFPIAAIICSSVCHAEIPETSARGGLPNVLAKLDAGEPVRVAYLGGSITEAAGWRVLSLEWLREKYPKAGVEEINATFSGTNSAFGAFRLGREVVAKKPDLLFVEFVMNDGSTDPQRTSRAMEGIVRQLWTAAPAADICFVYTVGKSTLPLYQAGSRPPAVEAMEKVADHYGVPSIDFGPAVAELEKSGKLTFTAPLPSAPAADGKIIFSGDGVHPHVETGHPLYLAAIQRSWPAISAAAKSAAPHQLPAPLDAASWQRAALLPMKGLARRGNWRELAADAPPMKSAGSRAPLMWCGEKPGDAIEFSFIGTCFGLYSLKGPDCGTFRVTVDSLPPVEAAKFDSFCVADRWRVSPWIYPQDLPDGVHRVRIEMTGTAPDKKAVLKDHFAKLPPDQRDGTRLYVSDVMVIGAAER